MRQGNADWATVGRPRFQALGGSGYLSYADILNNALGLDNSEARTSNRISVNNYLRVTGRELDMDVRSARGAGAAMPNPIKPFIGQMVMAAYANDAQGFAQARRAAIMEAMSEGRKREDAEDYAKRSYSSYHPLRVVFKTEPSQPEYLKILNSMDDNGRTSVATAVRMFNSISWKLQGSSVTRSNLVPSYTFIPDCHEDERDPNGDNRHHNAENNSAASNFAFDIRGLDDDARSPVRRPPTCPPTPVPASVLSFHLELWEPCAQAAPVRIFKLASCDKPASRLQMTSQKSTPRFARRNIHTYILSRSGATRKSACRMVAGMLGRW